MPNLCQHSFFYGFIAYSLKYFIFFFPCVLSFLASKKWQMAVAQSLQAKSFGPFKYHAASFNIWPITRNSKSRGGKKPAKVRGQSSPVTTLQHTATMPKLQIMPAMVPIAGMTDKTRGAAP